MLDENLVQTLLTAVFIGAASFLNHNLTNKLENNMKLVSNKDGIKGGARLWFKKEAAPINTAVSNV